MAQAGANNVGLFISAEETSAAGFPDTGSTWGVSPYSELTAPFATPTLNPDFKELRYTGETLGANKQTVVSEVITADRARNFLAEVAASSAGDINYEMAFGPEFEMLLSGALMANRLKADVTGATITAATGVPSAGLTRLTRSSGDFQADGFKNGAWVRIKNFDTGDGLYKISNVLSATQLDVVDADADIASATGGNEEVHQLTYRNGALQKSFLIEKRFTDISNAFAVLNGMRVGSMSMNATAQQIVTGTFSFEGKQTFPATASAKGSGTDTAADSSDQMNATSNVGTLTEGGVSLVTAVRSAQFSVNNNLRSLPAIGNKFPIGVGMGFMDVTGTLEAYFEDLTMYNKFLNHTSSSFSMRFTDAAGNAIIATVPNLYFSEGNPTAAGGNQDVILTLNFSGIKDATTGSQIQFDLLAA